MSTPASIPTRPRTSDICATPFSATLLSACCRFAGREVDVQNYIDNTGVQVADVVVGFLHIEKKSRAEIEQLARQPRFDYYCWDLYARVSQWYARGQAESAGPPADAARHRRRQQRNRRHRRSDFDRRPAPPSRDHGPARHRIRFSAARERDPPPAFLGRGLYQAERRRRALLRERRQEQRLLGDAAGGNVEVRKRSETLQNPQTQRKTRSPKKIRK